MSCFSVFLGCVKPQYDQSLTVSPLMEQTDTNLNISPNTATNASHNHPNNITNSNPKTPTKLYENSTTISNLTSIAKQSTSKKSIFYNIQKEPSTFYFEEPDYIPNANQTVSCSSKDLKLAGVYKLDLLEGDILDNNNNDQILITPNDIAYFYINNTDNYKPDGTKHFKLNYSNSNVDCDYFFVIFYIKELNQYKIKFNPSIISSMKDTVFIQIPSQFYIPINYHEYVTLGKSQIELKLNKKEGIDIFIIPTKKRLTFSSSSKQITFGRNQKCTIPFEVDNTVSKLNTIISYDIIRRLWMIKDGSEAKASMNGTWIFGEASYQIYSGMIIIIGNSKIRLTKSN